MSAIDQADDATEARMLLWARRGAVAVLVALLIIICATFRDYGISWDEMLQNTYGLKLLDFYSTGFHDRSAFSYVNLYLYGGLFDMLAGLANAISPFGEYETRHLLGGFVFVAGLVGAWRLTDLLAGSRAALLAVLCLALTPLLYGHAFINPKDSPFAWLGVWCLYYGARILAAPGKPTRGALVGFAVSLGLAMGTRAMALCYLFYLVLILALRAVLDAQGREKPIRTAIRRTWAAALPLLAVLPLAILLMAVFWPWSVFAPGNLVDAIKMFSRFSWQPVELWSGELIQSSDLPRVYVVRLLFFQLPEFVLAGLVLSLMWTGAAFRHGILATLRTPRAHQYLLLAVAIVTPLAAFMILRPVVYNGMRHFLFVVPPLVIVSAIALERSIVFVSDRQRLVGAMLAGFMLFGLVRECVILADLHPYEYVAYNSLTGGIAGAEKRFELDYWGTSLGATSRGLVDYLERNHVAMNGRKPRVYVCGDRLSAAYFMPDSIQTTDRLADADFYVGINDPPCRSHFDNPPNPLFAVQRDGVTLGYALDLRARNAGP